MFPPPMYGGFATTTQYPSREVAGLRNNPVPRDVIGRQPLSSVVQRVYGVRVVRPWLHLA